MTKPGINWPPPPAEVRLSANEVHVWAVALALPPAEIDALARLLSAEERHRAQQFKFPHLRHRFIVGRAALRSLLGRYLERAPAGLEFDYTARGKPELTGPGAGQWHFNLAHSHDLALIAVTQAAAVGVDVERIRPMPDAVGIAERFFSPRELAALRGVAPAARDAAFFRLWTRKEAWLKATGDGISESLSKIEVAFLREETPRVVAIAGDATAAEAWSLCALNPADGFVGALAMACREVRLHTWCAGL